MTSSANSLLNLCNTGNLEALTPAVAVDYGFNNCGTAENMQRLLELYQTLVSFPKFSTKNLHQNCIEGTLGEYISVMFTKNKSRNIDCFKWFQENSEVVKNSYPLEPMEDSEEDDDYDEEESECSDYNSENDDDGETEESDSEDEDDNDEEDLEDDDEEMSCEETDEEAESSGPEDSDPEDDDSE